MSKRSYFSQYVSPNIVIVPTVSLCSDHLAKKARLETQASIENMEAGVSYQESEKNLFDSDCHPDMNWVKKDLNNTVKKPKLNIKKHISTSQPLNVEHTVKYKKVNNMNDYSSERISFTGIDSKPLNDLCDDDNNNSNKYKNKYTFFPESDRNKGPYDHKNINKYIITKSNQVKPEEIKTSAVGKKLKRKIVDNKSKIIKSTNANKLVDLNKNSDSDFEEQIYRTTNNKLKKMDCLEPQTINKDAGKTDIKKTKKLHIEKSSIKSDKKHKSDKSSNISNVNKDSLKSTSNKLSTVSNKYKASKILCKKIITESIKEQPEGPTKNNCKPNTLGKMKSITKHDGHRASSKKMNQNAKVTPLKSVVQVTKYFGLNSSKNQDQTEKAIDLRTTIYRKNQTNTDKPNKKIYSHSKQKQKTGVLKIRDNLRITVNNNLNTQNEDTTKLPEKIKTSKSKPKTCKKIKLIINVICQNPLKGSLETLSSDSDDDKNDASYLFPTADLSFLDDINVDEIVESLKCTKNETDTVDNIAYGSSDLQKWDCSIKNIIKTEKENFVAQNEVFISNANQTENTNNNKRLSNVDLLSNQLSEAEHKFALQMYETRTQSILDIKQEIFENDWQQKAAPTLNINDIKKDDDAVSECSTVIIGELTRSDIEEATFENIDKSIVDDCLHNIHSNGMEAVSVQPKEVENSAEKLNEKDMTNILKLSSNMKEEINETPQLEHNLVFNDKNILKTVLAIKDNTTEAHLVNNKEIIPDNYAGKLNADLKLDTIQTLEHLEGTENISVLNSGMELSVINTKDNNEGSTSDSNKEHYGHIKATNKTTKIKDVDNPTPSKPQVVGNVTSAPIIGDACSILSWSNDDNDLLPIESSIPSKEISKSKVSTGDKHVNQCKIENGATVEQSVSAIADRSVSETVAKEQVIISPTVKQKISFNSMKKQENKCVNRSLKLVVNALSKQDQTLAVKLEERMFDYLKTQYTVLSMIAKGKFSKIFQIKDTNGQNYAIKILNNKSDRQALGFDKEKMLMDIQRDIPRENLNCIYMINGFSMSGYWCFLMEYYPKNLQEALRENNKSFHVDVVQTLARQLIAAVTVLRNYCIVHSDIKPRHVLLNNTNDRLKLCGFDSSYYIDTAALVPNIGTASYRPPEVILGFSAGFSIDVWSAALLIYQMSTNSKLFPGAFNNDILFKQMCTFGNMPLDMVQRSLYKHKHFMGNAFIRRHGYMGQEFVLTWTFNKSQRMHRTMMDSYHRDWDKQRSKYQQIKDMAKIKLLIKLLEQMLVLDPRDRLTIEFAFANPFIYERFT